MNGQKDIHTCAPKKGLVGANKKKSNFKAFECGTIKGPEGH